MKSGLIGEQVLLNNEPPLQPTLSISELFKLSQLLNVSFVFPFAFPMVLLSSLPTWQVCCKGNSTYALSRRQVALTDSFPLDERVHLLPLFCMPFDITVIAQLFPPCRTSRVLSCSVEAADDRSSSQTGLLMVDILC